MGHARGAMCPEAEGGARGGCGPRSGLCLVRSPSFALIPSFDFIFLTEERLELEKMM